ncbi:3819_t:CDS:1, partial [Scutellospora calospora]
QHLVIAVASTSSAIPIILLNTSQDDKNQSCISIESDSKYNQILDNEKYNDEYNE